ncbi:MAG: hypothetical protein N3C12_03930 [Candidatus Binatia bacterium]|nr:hypothetical protein [Candidatus Binatia bacterium]
MDGGLLNNLPVDIMKELLPSKVIAVDVSLDDGRRYTAERIPSPLECLLLRLRGEKQWVPTLPYVLMKATSLSGAEHVQVARKAADLHLSPPVGEFEMLDWSRLYDIVDLGYRYTQRILDGWLPAHSDWGQPHEVFDSRALSRWKTRDNTEPEAAP